VQRLKQAKLEIKRPKTPENEIINRNKEKVTLVWFDEVSLGLCSLHLEGHRLGA
jgi:hypothetical protein